MPDGAGDRSFSFVWIDLLAAVLPCLWNCKIVCDDNQPGITGGLSGSGIRGAER